jgi:uncharacterized membrane protein affecting hemolysin expression
MNRSDPIQRLEHLEELAKGLVQQVAQQLVELKREGKLPASEASLLDEILKKKEVAK